MRQGMMGMSVEDTFDQVVCSKSGNLLQKESVASVVGVKMLCQPHSAISKSNGCVCCKVWWQFRALLEMRIRMTHWPTPVSSLNTALFFRTNLLIQHRMVHSSGLLIIQGSSSFAFTLY